MLKLTRLNHHVVAINPDHICWVDAAPDTTLFMLGGEKILVRESLDELIAHVIRFRRLVRSADPLGEALGEREGDPPRLVPTRRDNVITYRSSSPPPPRSRRGE